jgi:mitochondrial fission protein ELM1
MKKKCLIWALVDDRTGNKNQILGVLKELDFSYKIKKVQYNFFANLPNFIIQLLGGSIHTNKFKMNHFPPIPDIIISCGRRTFPLASKIKKYMKPTPKFIHLMYPKYSLNIKSADIIFTPNHDTIKKKDNLIKTFGTPNKINYTLKKNIQSKISKPIVSVLIGGNHGRYKMKTDIIKEIIDTVSFRMKKKGSVLISTSRRTSNDIISYLDHIIEKNILIKNIYHPKTSKKKNSLNQMLSLADEIIVTGDSMSMLSESCNLKKPVRVFFNKDFCAPKHIQFCKNLISEGYAFPFETLLKKCHKIKVLNTTKLISNKIKKLLDK